jgi:hypothetical protein
MINSVKLFGLLILLTNIYIQANIIGDSQSLTNEDHEKLTNEEMAADDFINSVVESQILRMIRRLRKDDKKNRQKCVIKMAVCILSIPKKDTKVNL